MHKLKVSPRVGLLLNLEEHQFEWLAKKSLIPRAKTSIKQGPRSLGKSSIIRGLVQGCMDSGVTFNGIDTEDKVTEFVAAALSQKNGGQA